MASVAKVTDRRSVVPIVERRNPIRGEVAGTISGATMANAGVVADRAAAAFPARSAHGLRVARQIKSSICHVNGPTVNDETQMPFGGVNGSGADRFGGRAGIDSFTELRWITIETQPGHFPI